MAQSNDRERGMVQRRMVGAALIWLVAAAVTTEGASTYMIRSSSGLVSCVVTQGPDGPEGQSQLATEVRGPASPTGEILASLPTELRDFSSLPIRVVLLTPAGSSPVQRLPVLYDPTLQHPVVEGAPSSDGFARAVFPKDWLVAGSAPYPRTGRAQHLSLAPVSALRSPSSRQG